MAVDLVHRCRPMPALGDAVDHARHLVRETVSSPTAGTFGWTDLNTGLPVRDLVVILDALTAGIEGASANPWKITGPRFEWTGPDIRVVDVGDGRWVVATGHLDPARFVRCTRWVAERQRFAGPREPWAAVVAEHGVQLAYVHGDGDVLTFTTEPGDGTAIPVTVCGANPLPAGTVVPV